MKRILLYILTSLTLLIIIAIVVGAFEDRTDYSPINHGEAIIFAHRGYVNSTVENSTAAFSKSDSLGFNAIETDIRSTKDGKLIIFHDASCKRLLGIDANIDDLNWNEIKEKHLLYKGKKTENKVLSLDMFLNQTSPKKILYLDIKNTSKTIADSLLSILDRHPEHKNIIIADHNLLFLSYLKINKENIRVALEGFNKGKEWTFYIIPKKIKPDYYASSMSKVDENHMGFLNEHNLIDKKITYGVDHTNIKKVFDLGITNIILDYHHSMGTLDSLKSKIMKIN
ncbi:glycerophosphodiester phosphodiesterase family protein [Marivirga tractuosa]|uniref:glycerophosphodiester phosphodiesterase n=1 Tax=Marivirga tractuosa TaxID=1006 RepID=UPI0035D006A2